MNESANRNLVDYLTTWFIKENQPPGYTKAQSVADVYKIALKTVSDKHAPPEAKTTARGIVYGVSAVMRELGMDEELEALKGDFIEETALENRPTIRFGPRELGMRAGTRLRR